MTNVGSWYLKMSVLIDMPHCQPNSVDKVSFFIDITNPDSWHTITTPNVNTFKHLTLEGWGTFQHALGINWLQIYWRGLEVTKKKVVKFLFPFSMLSTGLTLTLFTYNFTASLFNKNTNKTEFHIH